jgi:hypothetical protein
MELVVVIIVLVMELVVVIIVLVMEVKSLMKTRKLLIFGVVSHVAG